MPLCLRFANLLHRRQSGLGLFHSLVRQRQLDQYRQGYLRFNPATSPADFANILKDMELLIERKLTLFPDDKRQIVDARVVKVGDSFRIEVASAALE